MLLDQTARLNAIPVAHESGLTNGRQLVTYGQLPPTTLRLCR